MNTKHKILKWVKTHGKVASSDLVKSVKISRQAIASHLSDLVELGLLIKTGSTRNALYEINPTPGKGHAKSKAPKKITLLKSLKGLEEDRVCNEVFRSLDLKTTLSSKAQTIFQYVFTEMVNNAIDHSRSALVTITVELFPKEVQFRVRDKGIGIFRNIQKKFKLANELEGLEHLLKGKQTTMPDKHSGEGIFFSSRIADFFEIKSHAIALTLDNKNAEVFIKEKRFEKGTEVVFKILNKSRKSLSDLFHQFTGNDHVFDRNEIRVVVSAQMGNLSRSEAKRLLFGLDPFKKITFDFKGVKEIGQGFADEIFRVFPKRHPSIEIHYENAVPVVEFMIRRAIQ
jgi:anti-sigma regulatory factor (Ser/Thr protein kinase)/predicted transcriptional regulator